MAKQDRKRKPGRPSAQAASGPQMRALIIAGAQRVYGEQGYHGTSVERILQSAGVSRPTFYRYFSDRDAVLDVIIGSLNDELKHLVETAVLSATTFNGLLEGVVDAYFDWGQRNGSLTGPVYRELHDEASPASVHRQRILDELMAIFTRPTIVGWQVTSEPLLIDAAIHLVEHLGHVTFWPTPLAAKERLRRRAVILQALRGVLGVVETSNRY